MLVKFKLSILFLLTVSLIIMSCGETTETAQREIQQPLVEHHQKELKQEIYDFDNPPSFRRDGQVTFIDGETGEAKAQIEVEIANTDFQRQMGLMYRPEMEENHGMLFLFDREIIQSFWMRNTLIPLDIIFINSRREIIDIQHAEETMSDKSYRSSKPAIFVVEVNLGFCEENNINIGDKISF